MNREDTSITQTSKEAKIEVHDLLKICGEKNKFQYKILLYICMVLFLMAFTVDFLSYGFLTPEFRCPTSDSNGVAK
jgi:hypothetical protein